MKISRANRLMIVLLLTSVMVASLQSSNVLGQTGGNSQMISGVLAHRMNAAEAQLLANSGINWVSADVTFDPNDLAQWSQVYTLAKQYNFSLMGILDQHLMNWSDTFTLSDWNNAVTQAVESFGDVVKTWEIWNEPANPDGPLGFYNGSAQAYVIMLQSAYNIIKAAAPADIVIGLGGVPLYSADSQTINTYTQQAYAWAAQVVQLGGMQYCDAIAVHAYPYGQYFPQLAGASFNYYLQQYQQLCPNKPIWLTEVGQESLSATWAATPTQQSSFLSQSYALFQGLGVKAYFWYELSDNYTSIADSNFGLFDNGDNQKPAFAVYVNEVNAGASPTASPLPTPTALPSQVPTITQTTNPTQLPSPIQTPTTQPTQTDKPSNPPTPAPEENWMTALAAVLAIAIMTVASVLLKRSSSFKRYSR